MFDMNKHVDGIDTESIGYKYCNSLNQFKIDFSAEIYIKNQLMNKSKPISHNELLKMI